MDRSKLAIMSSTESKIAIFLGLLMFAAGALGAAVRW
jgi:hypothetical protein